jgi:hypothetical protein
MSKMSANNVPIRRPPITLAELRFAHAELRREFKGAINEERLFAMHARQQAIVTDATKATKAAQGAAAAALRPGRNSSEPNRLQQRRDSIG